jgi:hypothetical protein
MKFKMMVRAKALRAEAAALQDLDGLSQIGGIERLPSKQEDKRRKNIVSIGKLPYYRVQEAQCAPMEPKDNEHDRWL